MARITNKEFEKTTVFQNACQIVTRLNRYQSFKPSKRQASKWRMKKGIAYNTMLRGDSI